MTLETINALPAHDLPTALTIAGLAPLDAHIYMTIGDYLRALHHSPDFWQPHVRWDHAMPFVGQYKLSIHPGHNTLWQVECSRPWRVEHALTFAELPQAICRLMLRLALEGVAP